MALFPVLKLEDIVQVDDQTRLDARSSYANGADSITQIEIDDGTGFVDVTSNQYLDTQYAASGDKVITLRLNGTETKSYSLTVITVADDNLFSKDSDLEMHEPEILRYVREGRNSYLDLHRRVQTLIIDWLDYNRYWKRDESRYTSADLIDIEDFKSWSTYWVLQLIFEGLSDKVDDKWMQKALNYKALADSAKGRGTYRLDYDADGTIDIDEKQDNWGKLLVRR